MTDVLVMSPGDAKKMWGRAPVVSNFVELIAGISWRKIGLGGYDFRQVGAALMAQDAVDTIGRRV